jgi:hypothetical protein
LAYLGCSEPVNRPPDGPSAQRTPAPEATPCGLRSAPDSVGLFALNVGIDPFEHTGRERWRLISS